MRADDGEEGADHALGDAVGILGVRRRVLGARAATRPEPVVSDNT